MESGPLKFRRGRGDFITTVFFNAEGLRPGWRLALFWLGLNALEFVMGPLIAVVRFDSARLGDYFLPLQMLWIRVLAFLAVLLVTQVMAWIEQRPLAAFGLPLRTGSPAWRFLSGYFFWGFLPLSFLLLVLRPLHVFYFGVPQLSLMALWWALIWLMVFVSVALLEEFEFRGYALQALAEGVGFWPGAVIVAVWFAWRHSFNPGESRIGIIMTGFFAIFACVTVRYTGNLWLAVGAHAGWDWGESFFFGVSDSGLQVPGHLFNPHIQGPDWLSGGSVGPEGSFLCLVLLAAMGLLFRTLYAKRGRPTLLVMPMPGQFRLKR